MVAPTFLAEVNLHTHPGIINIMNIDRETHPKLCSCVTGCPCLRFCCIEYWFQFPSAELAPFLSSADLRLCVDLPYIALMLVLICCL